MNRQPTALLLLIFACLSWGCNKTDPHPIRNLKFNLVILNEKQEKRTVLEDGMNFFIGLEVTNHSKESVTLDYEVIKRVVALFSKQPDFLAIYRKENGENSQQSAYIGKPYDPTTGINFLDILWPGAPWKLDPSDSRYFIVLPWNYSPTNQAIPPGSYHSSFHDTVLLEGFEIPIDTKISFKIN